MPPSFPRLRSDPPGFQGRLQVQRVSRPAPFHRHSPLPRRELSELSMEPRICEGAGGG